MLSVKEAENKKAPEYYYEICNRNENGRHRLAEERMFATCRGQYVRMFEPEEFEVAVTLSDRPY